MVDFGTNITAVLPAFSYTFCSYITTNRIEDFVIISRTYAILSSYLLSSVEF
jgi:hypothetical protein